MISDIKSKIENGETLTLEEQKEFLSLVSADFEKIKQENPQKYLEFITSLNQIVSDLNKELREAKAELKA